MEFAKSETREPHKDRTKGILVEHPEVRELIGKNPYSALAILGIAAAQIGLAAWVGGQAWWLVFLLAYTAGAVADHALFVLIHECAHGLIFKSRIANTLAGIFANIPILFPGSVSFQRYHLMHHSHQGVYDLDADLPSEWEARLVGNSFLGKALWLVLFPVAQISRTFRTRRIKLFDRWIVLNIAVVLTTNVLLYFWLGPKAIIYMFASFCFSIGLHPLGARWIQRHYLVGSRQETYSYYGPGNAVAFNVGYHNEHHDFPSVPWNRLPEINHTAPEWYDSLVAHRSWTKLLFRFLTDSDLSLYSRMVRPEHAKEIPTQASSGTTG